jgi:hypothetical protein
MKIKRKIEVHVPNQGIIESIEVEIPLKENDKKKALKAIKTADEIISTHFQEAKKRQEKLVKMPPVNMNNMKPN